MENYLLKIKHIVPRFILVTVVTTILILLFRWLIVIKYNLLPIKEKYFHIWIPIFLPMAVHWIWVEKKFRILKLKKYYKETLKYDLTIVASIMGVLIFSNFYLKIMTGELRIIDTIDEITNDASRYIYFKNVNVDSEVGSLHESIKLIKQSGRYNWRKNIEINNYVVVPIKSEFNNKEYWEDRPVNHVYWYGIKLTKIINNQLDEDEKNELYKTFVSKSIDKLNAYNFNEPKYFEILSYSDDKEGFIQAIEKLNLNLQDPPIILIPLDKNPKEGSDFYLMWAFLSFIIGLILLLIMLIYPNINEEELVN